MNGQAARTSCLGTAALLLFAFAVPARPAQSQEHKESDTIVDAWLEQFKEAEQLLREGEWKKVRKQLDSQLDVMIRRMQPDSDSAGLLGAGLGLRAIAEAGLGDYDDATWDWNVAKAFAPAVESVDLGQFGSAGEFIRSDELESRSVDPKDPWPELVKGDRQEVEPVDEPSRGLTLTPPKKRWGKRPEYPRPRAGACFEGPVIVRLIVDPDGIPRSPSWQGNDDAALVLAALEAVKTWRFEPARVDGEPVHVYYSLTVNWCTAH